MQTRPGARETCCCGVDGEVVLSSRPRGVHPPPEHQGRQSPGCRAMAGGTRAGRVPAPQRWLLPGRVGCVWSGKSPRSRSRRPRACQDSRKVSPTRFPFTQRAGGEAGSASCRLPYEGLLDLSVGSRGARGASGIFGDWRQWAWIWNHLCPWFGGQRGRLERGQEPVMRWPK